LISRYFTVGSLVRCMHQRGGRYRAAANNNYDDHQAHHYCD
jgi:hypothetical protein